MRGGVEAYELDVSVGGYECSPFIEDCVGKVLTSPKK